jgi:hypothetical protein
MLKVKPWVAFIVCMFAQQAQAAERYTQGCGTIVERKDLYVPSNEINSWGNAGDVALLGSAGGLGSLVAAIGAQVISSVRDAINTENLKTDVEKKPNNAVSLTFKSDFGDEFSYLYTGRAVINAKGVEVGQRGFVRIYVFDKNTQAKAVPVFVSNDSTPSIPNNINDPSIEYLDFCYKKSPNGYTSLTPINAPPSYLMFVPAPAPALQKLLARDAAIENKTSEIAGNQ